MAQPVNHWPDVRDKAGFLRRLMGEFAGGRMSLEGDLSRCHFPDDLVLAREETGLLRRGTLYPRQDFVVLRLDPGDIETLFDQVTAAGLSQAILHVQIEVAGVLQLGAYDNFHPRCVVTGPRVSVALLSEMTAKGILRGYEETCEGGPSS
jgi:hypothetical protein